MEEKYFERFWSRVDVRGPDECWLWHGTIMRNGYGTFSIRHKAFYAHRLSVELCGEDATGLDVCHHCDTPLCVNPRHLFLGTAKDNILDMVRKGRGNRAKGERNKSSRLTSQDVIEIRRLHESGVSKRQLSKMFNVGRTTIRSLLSGKTWKHV